MALQFALYSDWRFGLVQPRPKAVAEGLPADPGCDLGGFSRSSDALLLKFLLMKPPACGGIGEQPLILRYVAMLPVLQQLASRLGAIGTASREYSVFTSPTLP